MAYIRHDSHSQVIIKNRQALGAASPLETDDDGYAEVEDDETATLLAAIDRNVSVSSAPPDDNTDDGDGEFDAAGFVDRTPMETVIVDIESGEYDEYLDEIASAERDGRDRTGVADAISERQEE